MTSNAATKCVAKMSILRLKIGSGMLRLSSCRLRLGLRLSIGSCMLRLGLRLRLSFRGSGWPLLLLKLNLSLNLSTSLSMQDPMLSMSPSLSMHQLSLSMPEPILSLSMLILATHLVAGLDVTIRTQNQN